MRRIKSLKKNMADIIKERFSLTIDVPVEYPPHPEFGDVATPIAFEMARKLKKNPVIIAEEIVSSLKKRSGIEKEIERIEIAGNGYINIFFHKTEFVKSLFKELTSPFFKEEHDRKTKVIVEHTNINPNKAAHIGHLRNAILGDTLGRILDSLGYQVEVQNYIDDTGVQVADIVIGFQNLLHYDLDQVKKINEKFDYFCWDLYARVTSFYEEHPEFRRLQSETLKKIEDGENPVAEMASYIAQRIVDHHLQTMERIGVRYQLLVWESHVLALKFWEKAFKLLQDHQAIRYSKDGQSQGCWVMNLPIFSDSEVVDEAEKIIVRSNGTATYVGKDIAYQLWKFGLLKEDFHYRRYRSYHDETFLWSTTLKPHEKGSPHFGKAQRVYNVIDVRQTYPQKIVKESLNLLGFSNEADHSIHFGYEMVALSPKCALDMGFEITEQEKKKPYIEISGRKGQGVKADDLLDRLYSKALREVCLRHPELGEKDVDEIAKKISSGSLRYFMLKFARNKIISFDFDDALNFDGETGPYVQYAAVRSHNIFRRMGEKEGFEEKEVADMVGEIDFNALEDKESLEHWELVTLISRWDDLLEQSLSLLELSIIAKYGFHLAQKFNTFYQKYPVMNEQDPRKKKLRIIITYLFKTQITRVLQIMGIEIPQRM